MENRSHVQITPVDGAGGRVSCCLGPYLGGSLLYWGACENAVSQRGRFDIVPLFPWLLAKVSLDMLVFNSRSFLILLMVSLF